MKREIEGYIKRAAAKQHWRVAYLREYDDLVQDGYLCYVQCLRRYPNVSPPEFMALLKKTFENHVHKLSAKQSKMRLATVDAVTTDDALESHRTLGAEVQHIVLAIKQAPELIRQLSEALISEERLANERQNTFYCRLLGLNHKKNDVESLVTEYFTA